MADTTNTADTPKTARSTAELRQELVQDAVLHLDFLSLIEAHGSVLYDREVLDLAAARYELLWLPLCRDALRDADSPANVRPPLDIAFVMHCHVLNPTRCAACTYSHLECMASSACCHRRVGV